MSCGVGCRYGTDPVLLWLWCRPSAVAPIQPLAWELPYAISAALKRLKKKKKVIEDNILLNFPKSQWYIKGRDLVHRHVTSSPASIQETDKITTEAEHG